VALLSILSCAAGCTTTSTQRDRARDLATNIESYRQDQSKRLDELNRRYQFDYAQLVAEMTRLRLGQLDQFFELDSMDAAGVILVDWQHETLPKKIKDRFAASLERRRMKLLEVDKAIEDARSAYADAYQAVQLKLTQLKTAQTAAQSLSVPEDRRQAVADVVLAVGRVVNNLRDEAAKEEKEAKAVDDKAKGK